MCSLWSLPPPFIIASSPDGETSLQFPPTFLSSPSSSCLQWFVSLSFCALSLSQGLLPPHASSLSPSAFTFARPSLCLAHFFPFLPPLISQFKRFINFLSSHQFLFQFPLICHAFPRRESSSHYSRCVKIFPLPFDVGDVLDQTSLQPLRCIYVPCFVDDQSWNECNSSHPYIDHLSVLN